MTNILTPFEPATPSIAPEQPAEKPKRGPKPGSKRQRRVAAVNEAPVEAPVRRKRATTKVRQPASLKLPIDVAMSVARELHADDAPLFDKLIGILAGAAKGQRERVLSALGKVFS